MNMTSSQGLAPLPSSGTGVAPTVEQITSTLKDGDDPLSFIRNNLRTRAPSPSNPQVQVADAAATRIVERPKIEQTFIDDLLPSLDDELQQAAPVADPEVPPAQEPPPAEPVEDKPLTPEELLAQQKSPEESIKNLRKKYNEEKAARAEKERLAAELEDKVKKYETGELVAEAVKEKDGRIAELEYYERLHALKLSPEFNKKFIQPLEDLKEKARNIAKDYEVDAGVFDAALNIQNKRELNSFLTEHFDEVGALEAREVVEQIRATYGEMQAAEAEPKDTLAQLQESFAREQEAAEHRRINTISSNSKDGWTSALMELRDTEQYPELVVTGDPEHDKISKPLLDKAASEYGKFVKYLGENDVKNLDTKAAKVLAKVFQMAYASAVIARSRAEHFEASQEVINHSKKISSMIRPPVGSGIASGATPAPRPKTPMEAAEMLLRKVGVG